jgi:hypothetical protein
MWKKFVKGVTWGLAGVAVGVLFGFVAGILFSGALGQDNILVLPVVFGIVCGISGASFGISSVKERRNRGRRRRSGRSRRSVFAENAPQELGGGEDALAALSSALQAHSVALAAEPSAVAPGAVASETPAPAFSKDLAQFETATGVPPADIQKIRVCDIRLDEDGLPISVHLPSDAEAPGRDIFLVLDSHRLTVARVLENAMRREPGNTKAKLFS